MAPKFDQRPTDALTEVPTPPAPRRARTRRAPPLTPPGGRPLTSAGRSSAAAAPAAAAGCPRPRPAAAATAATHVPGSRARPASLPTRPADWPAGAWRTLDRPWHRPAPAPPDAGHLPRTPPAIPVADAARSGLGTDCPTARGDRGRAPASHKMRRGFRDAQFAVCLVAVWLPSVPPPDLSENPCPLLPESCSARLAENSHTLL